MIDVDEFVGLGDLGETEDVFEVDTARFFGDAQVPSLAPWGLDLIPGYRLDAFGNEDDRWRTEWFDYRERAIVVRERVWAMAELDEVFAAAERAVAMSCPHYFKLMYATIGEPRPRSRMTDESPFIPFHFQIHLTNDTLALIAREDEEDHWRPKGRGLGVSWNNQTDEAWLWLARPVRVILSSRNENLVADIENVDAMFGKVFYVLRHLPPHILPAGFDPHNPGKGRWWNSSRMLLTNHDRTSQGYGAQMVGSPTTRNIGRQGRYTLADVDEGQAIPKLDVVLQSLRGSTPHILITGTEGTEQGEDFVDGWQTAKSANPSTVWELNSHQNAWQDRYWLARQYARATTPSQKAKVALEFERNYFAGGAGWIYPEARFIKELDLPYRPELPLITSFDPGKDDPTAALTAQLTTMRGQRGIHVLFSAEYDLTEMEWLAHVYTGIWPDPELDLCGGMTPTREEAAIGAFYYDVWANRREMQWFIDPAGKASQTNTSFFSLLEEKSGQLRLRRVTEIRAERILRAELGEPVDAAAPLPDPYGITCQFLRIEENRLHNQRHYATRKMIPFSSVQRGVASAKRAKTCLMRYQMNPLSPKAVTEAVPLHNIYSHMATTWEWIAIYLRYGMLDPLIAPDGTKFTGPGKRPIPTGAQLKGLPEHYPRRAPGRPAPPPDRGRRTPPGRWR